jgi:ubiquinone biosynthesis protein
MIIIFKEVIFLFQLFIILLSESFWYVIWRDYSYFICNITLRLSKLNILYVKLFQAIASNHQLIDDKINNQLLNFTDNAPWDKTDIKFEELVECINTYNIQLQHGYEQPINSGMISLVFKGKLRGKNNDIVIKIKRNNIDKKLKDAIDNILFLIKLVSFLPIIRNYEIEKIVNKNIDIIKNQTNFFEEVGNIQKMKENCKNLKYIKIPHVYKEVTDNFPNIIMMEYIEGKKINEILEEDYEEFAKQVLKFGFVTSILHGLIHGDLHSGNILFIKDNNADKYKHKIGILDFGIVYKLKEDNKNAMFEIIIDIFNTTAKATAQKLLTCGLIEPLEILNSLSKNHYDTIIDFTTEILEDTIYQSKKANQIQIYKFLDKFNKYITNNEISMLGLRPSDYFIKMQLIMAMSHGITLTLCKNDYIALADKVINELFHTNILTE